MNVRNKQLTLIVLLFGFAATLAYWQFHGALATGGDGKISKPGDTIPAPDSIGKVGRTDGPGGGIRNLFGFGRSIDVAPAPPKVEFTKPLPPVEIPTIVDRPGPPPGPGPITTPPIQLAYTGYARDDFNRMTAFLETSGANAPAGHYNLRETDFLLGRYRINRITADAIEVEDIDRAEAAADRKRTITITPALAVRK